METSYRRQVHSRGGERWVQNPLPVSSAIINRVSTMVVTDLLSKAAVEKVTNLHPCSLFFNCLFLIPKLDGTKHSILDLNVLNLFVRGTKFTMEITPSIHLAIELILNVPLTLRSKNCRRFTTQGSFAFFSFAFYPSAFKTAL